MRPPHLSWLETELAAVPGACPLFGAPLERSLDELDQWLDVSSSQDHLRNLKHELGAAVRSLPGRWPRNGLGRVGQKMGAVAFHSHVEHDEACVLREAESVGFCTGASIHRHVDS